MTETTRSNLLTHGEGGSRVWYRDAEGIREIPLRLVSKVRTRIGDDAKVQGAFKPAAAIVSVEQIHNSVDRNEQQFEDINRPGVLVNIDGQLNATVHGLEIAQATVDKVNEKSISRVTVSREITGRGVWSRVVGKRASTEVFTDILISDAIKRTLEAIDVPYGRIDPTPNATLTHFWLSDRQDATSILLGLVDAAGPRARLDDYEGVITFSAEPSTEDRLTIYGGSGIGGFSGESATVTARTPEGDGIFTGGSGTIPSSSLYPGFAPFQGSLGHRHDRLNNIQTWFIQPYSRFTYSGQTYVVELIRSGYHGSLNRYYMEATITSETNNVPFATNTFSGVYINWRLGGNQYRRKQLASQSDEWNDLPIRVTGLSRVPPRGAGLWLFRSNTVRDGIKNVGRYRFEITKEMAEEIGVFNYTIASDRDALFGQIDPPSDSQRIIFADWKRNDDDSRYFNSVSVTSVNRRLETDAAVLWESPEDIEVTANGSLTIRVSSDDGTPFALAGTDPFEYDENPNLHSINANRGSGAEIDVTITAGDANLVLQNLMVRGRYYAPTLERNITRADNAAIALDDTVEWESAGTFPVDLDQDYLDSWIDARLELGLERRWTTTIKAFGWDTKEAGYLRNNWQTLMRLRPGRLIEIVHGRATWLGLIREISRTSGSAVDHIDQYEITCELTTVAAFDNTILRVGQDAYGSDKVLG